MVKSKDQCPLYEDVIAWLLKHDLLISLHLYIRIVIPYPIKLRFSDRRTTELKKKKKRGYYAFDEENLPENSPENKGVADASPVDNWLSMSPKTARKQTHQRSQPSSTHTPELDDELLQQEKDDIPEDRFDVEEEEQRDPDEVLFDAFDDNCGDIRPELIIEPSRATALQNAWLAEMSRDKDPNIVKLFQK